MDAPCFPRCSRHLSEGSLRTIPIPRRSRDTSLEIARVLGEPGTFCWTDGSAALAPADAPLPACPEPGSIAAAWHDLREVASALGVPERGVLLLAQLRRRMAAIAERTAALPASRIVVLVRVAPPHAAGAWVPELAALAGAEDALGRAGDPSRRVTRAAFAAADADAVFVAPAGLGLAHARAELAARAERPPWAGTRAQREGRVFLADGDACFRGPAPRLVLTLEVLAEALHPDAFRFGHAGRHWEPLAD